MKKKIRNIKFVMLFLSIIISQNLFSQTSSSCWKSFSGGEFFSLGITTDGKLWSWGFNNYAQLGQGTQGNTANPNKSQIGNETQWKEVEAGFEYGIAIKNNGTLWAWGANFYGMLGDGTGQTRLNPTQIGTDTNWDKISAGTLHTLAIKTDGTMWAWGRNDSGQLGDGSYIIKAIPTQIGTDTDWTAITVGQFHSLAIKSNGTLWAWGSYSIGQLGLGNTSFTKINIPTQVGTTSDWKCISAGRNFNLAIKNNGTLWSWGENDFGQLGNGLSFGGSNIPVQIGVDIDWASIATGALHSIALKANGTRWAWGSNGSGSNISVSKGALGDNTIINKNIPTQIGTDTDWQKPNAGIYFSLCLKNDGSLWSNGGNIAGELGDNTQVASRIPILVTCPITLSNKGFEFTSLSVYPNPTKGILTISAVENTTIDKVEIVDVLGKTVLVKTETTSQIDISEMNNGVYVFKMYSGENVFVKKIIKN